MKKFLAAAAAVGLTAFAAPAFAQNIDGSLAYTAIDADGVDLGAVTARLSWISSGPFGVEGEASFGVRDDTVSFTGPPAVMTDVELKHQVAIYGTVGAPLGENSRVFARVGYGTQKIEASVPGFTGSGSDESINYGVGAQFLFDGRNGIRADYTRLDFDDGGDADTWSIGYVRRFQ